MLPFEEKRNRVLLKLYELHTTNGPRVDVYELENLVNVARIDFFNMLRELGRFGKGWLKKSNEEIFITAEGIDKAEELRKMQMVKLERLILHKFYDLGGPTHMAWVNLDTLTKELNMKFSDLSPVLNDLEDRNLLGGNGEAMWLTPDGVREVQNPGGDRAVGIKYETHFHAAFQGAVNQGPGGRQNINIQNIKNEFDDAIYKLLKGVENSTDLSSVQKMTVAGDIRTLQQLGEMEKTPEVIEAANSKIEIVNSVISSTADMVSLGMVVIPIIRLWFGL